MNSILFTIGAIDTAIILALGVTAAAMMLLGKNAEVFYNRILPACAVLIGTSIAAGIAMAATRWISGL